MNFADTGADPVAAVRAATEAAASRPFARIEADHLAAHRALFRRFSLSLGPGRSELPTDARIASLPARPDPGLAALYVQYARYLLIACSRQGTSQSPRRSMRGCARTTHPSRGLPDPIPILLVGEPGLYA